MYYKTLILRINKMSILKRVLVIVVLLMALSSSAQNYTKSNPGFMGKHFIVTGEGTFSGSIFLYPNYWIKYGGTAEYIIGRRSSIGVSYLHNSSNIEDVVYNDDCYNYNHFTFNTHQLGIDYYLYPSSVAPLGRYFRFQIAYLANYSDDFYKNGLLIPGKDPYSFRGYESDRVSSSNLLFSIFVGKKRVFYKSLVVSYGFQIGMTLNNPVASEFINEFADTSIDDDPNESLFLSVTADENFYSSWICFKMNVGFIW